MSSSVLTTIFTYISAGTLNTTFVLFRSAVKERQFGYVRFQFCTVARLRTEVFWVAALSRRISDCRRFERSCCFHLRGLGSPTRRDFSCRSAQHLKMKAIRFLGTWRVTDSAIERNNTAADLKLHRLISGVHEVGQWMCRKSFLWFRLSSHTVFDSRLLC
jgi:hypothetical protein